MDIKENLTPLKVPLEMSRGSSRTAKAFAVLSSSDTGPKPGGGRARSGEGSISYQGGPSVIVGLPLSAIQGHPLTGVTHWWSRPMHPSSPQLLPSHPCSAASCPFMLPTLAPENRNKTGHSDSMAKLSLPGHHPVHRLRPPRHSFSGSFFWCRVHIPTVSD